MTSKIIFRSCIAALYLFAFVILAIGTQIKHFIGSLIINYKTLSIFLHEFYCVMNLY